MPNTMIRQGVMFIKRCFILLISLWVPMALSAPFETCPSKAYLFQANPVQVYGVNLVTGQTTLLQSDTGMNVNINGVGFDFDSRYIYGYDTTNKRIVRLGADFQAEVINTSGLPTDHTFYVGDVFDKTFYLYRTGKGLFTIDLTPLDSDPNAVLQVVKVTGTATVKLTDFAFHPGTEKLYGIDNDSGFLYEFDPDTGSATYVGDTGQLGTFGAGYFDVNGYYYVSRNQDGQIYRVDLSDSNASNIANGIVTAVKFADGPMSGQNDGARCANAPVIDEDSTIDFGDAPDTYNTTLNSNGPRHQMDGVTWLGAGAPDGEQDGLVGNIPDDDSGFDDENGVGFVTSYEAGLDSIVRVNASTTGYLSAWFDWNQDGDFADEGEQVFADQLLSAGNNDLIFTVDLAATVGTTWSRFRFSQQTGLSYDGGSTSGEVEDHQLTVVSTGVSVRHYPDASNYVTIAYEDQWPYTADYDMNDVVMRYRITEVLRDGEVIKSTISGYLAAVGADYHNGFAVRLQGLNREDIDPTLTRQYHNSVLQAESGLEADSTEAIFIINSDLATYKGSCEFHRTRSNCQEDVQFTFELHVSVKDGVSSSALIDMPYDPFIFATPDLYHGEGYFHPGRGWELHLADMAPTEKFDTNMYGMGADNSNSASGIYYKTANNLPWALIINDEWLWPLEKVDLLEAYPKFEDWAINAGQQNADWFMSDNAQPNKRYEP